MGELIHLVTCLKKIGGPKIKKTWMDYYLINILEKTNKFFVVDLFVEIIIKENKDKVKLSTNATSEKFLRETVMLNIISLAKTREVIAKESGIINYSNHHKAKNNTIDVLKFVQLLVKNSIFEE